MPVPLTDFTDPRCKSVSACKQLYATAWLMAIHLHSPHTTADSVHTRMSTMDPAVDPTMSFESSACAGSRLCEPIVASTASAASTTSTASTTSAAFTAASTATAVIVTHAVGPAVPKKRQRSDVETTGDAERSCKQHRTSTVPTSTPTPAPTPIPTGGDATADITSSVTDADAKWATKQLAEAIQRGIIATEFDDSGPTQAFSSPLRRPTYVRHALDYWYIMTDEQKNKHASRIVEAVNGCMSARKNGQMKRTKIQNGILRGIELLLQYTGSVGGGYSWLSDILDAVSQVLSSLMALNEIQHKLNMERMAPMTEEQKKSVHPGKDHLRVAMPALNPISCIRDVIMRSDNGSGALDTYDASGLPSTLRMLLNAMQDPESLHSQSRERIRYASAFSEWLAPLATKPTRPAKPAEPATSVPADTAPSPSPSAAPSPAH